jgi:hypothetical protein
MNPQTTKTVDVPKLFKPLLVPAKFREGIEVPALELMTLSSDDLDALRYAKRLLENPGLAAKITNVLGRPIEKGLDLLPQKWAQVVAVATRTSLETALQVALATMGDTPRAPSWERLHKLAAATTGAAGGAVINLLFIDHFQDMARGHFIVRRLERAYPPGMVREEYERLPH